VSGNGYGSHRSASFGAPLPFGGEKFAKTGRINRAAVRMERASLPLQGGGPGWGSTTHGEEMMIDRFDPHPVRFQRSSSEAIAHWNREPTSPLQGEGGSLWRFLRLMALE